MNLHIESTDFQSLLEFFKSQRDELEKSFYEFQSADVFSHDFTEFNSSLEVAHQQKLGEMLSNFWGKIQKLQHKCIGLMTVMILNQENTLMKLEKNKPFT